MSTPRLDFDVLAGRTVCPNDAAHTRHDGRSYIELARAEAAEGRFPLQCPDCGLYVIWPDPEPAS